MKSNQPEQLKALILTADRFEDLEVFYPYYRLKEEGWKVVVAAPDTAIISGKHGYQIHPDEKIREINPDDFDLLLLPGGSKDGAPSTVRKIPNSLAIARSFMVKNKLIGAICHGPYTLISADLVKGKHLTSVGHDNVPQEIIDAGGIWEDSEVVIDGNLITSRTPKDLPAFMKAILIQVVDKT